MLLFSLGIIVGVLLSLIAIIVGKRLEVKGNTSPNIQPKLKQAMIIKSEPDEFMDEING